MSSVLGMSLLASSANSFRNTTQIEGLTNGNKKDEDEASQSGKGQQHLQQQQQPQQQQDDDDYHQVDNNGNLENDRSRGLMSEEESSEMKDSDHAPHDDSESDDDLFIGPPPALDDDDEDEDEDFEDDHRPIASFMEDSDSAIMPSDSADGDVTLGSPGLRRAFRDDDDDEEEEDDVTGHHPVASRANVTPISAVRSRRNKRKNFRPRNIVYNATEDDSPAANNDNGTNNNNEDDDEDEEDSGSGLPLNLSSVGSEMALAAAAAGLRKTLMPRKHETTSSPIDLSVPSSHFQRHDGGDAERRSGNLSVVRPEILFGAGSKLPPVSSHGGMLPQMPLPPMQFGPSLAALAAAASASERQAAAVSMKEAFQEVLKLYGVPLELAEAIAKNANNCTPEKLSSPPTSSDSPTSSSIFGPMGSFPPGLLSSALLGNSNSPSGGGHPPTPPRTPKSAGPEMQQPRFQMPIKIPGSPASCPPTSQHLPPASSVPTSISGGHQMPPLLSLASIHDKSPNILAAHLNKPMMHPGISASLSSTLGIPHPPPPSLAGLGLGHHGIPPHILAAQRVGMLPGKSASTDYTRYFKRFGSSMECGSYYCKDMNYREHFHCTVLMCKDKVFAKKEEMIRHSKWHQKMEEAFKYGFRRVTPTDDCSDHFAGCQHNKKQTHYHCIQSEGCDKVYISTSDVQMHFNYHRKDNAIQREGFLRFRGQEDCGTSYCPFRDQKTTHFHCNRGGCNFTFKNKADMEKHKNFHMKDEQLNKDGFKKFMKNDECGFDTCRFAKTVNHIHCIRDNCDYVLHSSGQLYSHKRKHERKDNEIAYRKYKLAQSMMHTDQVGGNFNGDDRPPSSNGSAASESSTPPLHPGSHHNMHNSKEHFFQSMAAGHHPGGPHGGLSALLPHLKPHPMFGMQFSPPNMGFGSQPMLLSELIREKVPEDAWQNYMLHFDAGEGCGFQGCAIEDLEHFHCKDDGCETVFRKGDEYREHGRNHFIQDQISEVFFLKSDPEEDDTECPDQCPHKTTQIHYHCKWENCTDIIFNSDPPFKRLDHYKLHEYTRKWNMSSGKEPVSMTLSTSIDAMFKRKRGRPPKNRVVEFPGHMGSSSSDMHGSPQAVFTSFKLPKPGSMDHMHMPPMPGSPFGMGSRFPVPASYFQTTTTHSGGITSSPRVMSAPLGGLPAVDSQMAARQQQQQHQQQQQQQQQQHLHQQTMKMMSQQPPNRHMSSPDRGSDDEDDCRSISPKSLPTTPKSGVPRTSEGGDVKQEGNSSDESPPKIQGLIKARGTYYPLTAFPTTMPQGPVMHRDDSPPRTELQPKETSPTISLKSKLGLNFMVSFTRQGETDNPLAKLLQASQDMVSSASTSNVPRMPGDNNLSGLEERLLNVNAHPLFGPEPEEESCGRPFCKLKRRAHYHCNLCNQGFTERDKLEQHLRRHATHEGPEGPTSGSSNLAALLKDGLPKEPVNFNPSEPISKSMHEEARERHEMTSHTPPVGAPPSSNSRSSPATSAHSPRPSPPALSSTSPLSNPGGGTPFPGFPNGFPGSPFGMVRYPPMSVSGPGGIPVSLSSQSPLLLPPGVSPFLPNNLLLPGMPNPFQRFPGSGDPSSVNAALARLQSPNSVFDSMKSISPLSHLPDANSRKRSSPMGGFLDEESMEQKKFRLASSMRMLKDEPVPEGYMRFRFNEDCSFTCCNYREHQTHFHCMRKDCNYRFCDKTRFVQHTARHERLDTLCGSEFEGFRGVTCARDSCEFNIHNLKVPLTGDAQKSSSHFHCLKCDYYCTDTNKVVAHRRQHQKLDSINAAGFEKYTPTQFCQVNGCGHNGKQTHYHCGKCQYAVLGLSQMEAHKYRHVNEND